MLIIDWLSRKQRIKRRSSGTLSSWRYFKPVFLHQYIAPGSPGFRRSTNTSGNSIDLSWNSLTHRAAVGSFGTASLIKTRRSCSCSPPKAESVRDCIYVHCYAKLRHIIIQVYFAHQNTSILTDRPVGSLAQFGLILFFKEFTVTDYLLKL